VGWFDGKCVYPHSKGQGIKPHGGDVCGQHGMLKEYFPIEFLG